ncbi:MAG TPA: hypothetical protein VMU71_01200 [Terracidiphilus sp.]|nr:hypothetical protein [Terracidiphilus sp.]
MTERKARTKEKATADSLWGRQKEKQEQKQRGGGEDLFKIFFRR